MMPHVNTPVSVMQPMICECVLGRLPMNLAGRSCQERKHGRAADSRGSRTSAAACLLPCFAAHLPKQIAEAGKGHKDADVGPVQQGDEQQGDDLQGWVAGQGRQGEPSAPKCRLGDTGNRQHASQGLLACHSESALLFVLLSTAAI